MTSAPIQTVLTLEPNDPHLLAQLCGQFDEHLQMIEQRLAVRIGVRGNSLALEGSQSAVDTATEVIESLYRASESGTELNPETVHIHLQEAGLEQPRESDPNVAALALIRTKQVTVKPRGKNQQLYVRPRM